MEEASFRRLLQALIAFTVSASELGKVAWSRYLNDGYGYWWMSANGFSFFHNEGGGGQIWEALLSLLLALVAIDLVIQWTHQCCGSAAATWLHGLMAINFLALCTADLALCVGAGGARISLPLVLFAVTECGYVFRMVRPWMHYVVLSLGLVVSLLLLLAPKLQRLARALPMGWRVPWLLKGLLAAYCGRSLWSCRRSSEGVGADLISQLGSDAVAMLWGKLLPSEDREAMITHATSKINGTRLPPPVLIFHWEAASDVLLEPRFAGAMPFLHGLLDREDVFAGSAVASVPVTLKTAWEVLCGVAPAATADFREQGSDLRRECLPRALKRCCGYRSVLAKTDVELPDLPQRVFGFEATVVAENMSLLLPKLRTQLELWDGEPIFMYFYGGDAHPPYHAGRVEAAERGLATEELLDVYLALNRRTDQVAEALSHFWPPPSDGLWQRKHGLAFYLGDHGEQLHGVDPPPHGNLVSPEVSRTLMALEARSYAQQVRKRPLVRMADVYATVAHVAGLHLEGELFVGRSLLRDEEHDAIASFSFYRPGDLAAVHFVDPWLCSAEFVRGARGWALHEAEALRNSWGAARRLEPIEGAEQCRDQAMSQLRAALARREQQNQLLTESNVHAAWLVASMRAAALKAKAFAAWVVKSLHPFLPAPKFDPNCSVRTDQKLVVEASVQIGQCES